MESAPRGGRENKRHAELFAAFHYEIEEYEKRDRDGKSSEENERDESRHPCEHHHDPAERPCPDGRLAQFGEGLDCRQREKRMPMVSGKSAAFAGQRIAA